LTASRCCTTTPTGDNVGRLSRRSLLPAATKAGAVEVLTKPLATDVLMSAIWHAVGRSRAAVNQLTQIRRLQERYASLGAREREVMGLVVSGRLNKQVSGDLGIIEFHGQGAPGQDDAKDASGLLRRAGYGSCPGS